MNTAEKCHVPFKIQGIQATKSSCLKAGIYHIFRCLIVFFLSIQWVILRPFATVTRPIGMCQILLRAPDDSTHLYLGKKKKIEPWKPGGRGLQKAASPSPAQRRAVWVVLIYFFLCAVKVPSS